MTLQEAMKSGKRIKREFWSQFQNFSLDNAVTIEGAFSDDWEVEHDPKQKVKMYKALCKNENGTPYETPHYFKFEDEAERTYTNGFIRLLTEYPIEVEI